MTASNKEFIIGYGIASSTVTSQKANTGFNISSSAFPLTATLKVGSNQCTLTFKEGKQPEKGNNCNGVGVVISKAKVGNQYLYNIAIP